MRCAACGVAIPDGRVTFAGQPICKKCMLRGFGLVKSKEKKAQT